MVCPCFLLLLKNDIDDFLDLNILQLFCHK